MRIGILFSSGKDSVNTLWYYLEQGWDVACLLSLLPQNPDSYMFQNPDEKLLTAQAASFDLPLITQRTEGEEEKELDDLKELMRRGKARFSLDGIAAGALASDYQHERVTRMCHELELKTFAPLWHKDQEQLLREMIDAGFDIRMTRIAADGLDEVWLGRRLALKDVDLLSTLHRSTGFHTAGEGGEFETIVLDGPIFSAPISIAFEKEMESECRGELRITKVDG